MPWIGLIPPIALAAVFMIGIGLPASLALGARGFLAVALSPLLAVTAIAVGAIIAGAVGVPWGWWAPVASCLLLTGVAWLARAAMRRLGIPMRSGTTRGDLRYWVAWALGAALLALQLKTVLGRPDSFAQRFDNLFHLNAIRYVVVTENGSSLTLGRLTLGDVPTAFYPAAFHDAASLVLQSFPASLPVAVNAVLAVICVLIWPAACLAMTRLIMPSSWAAALTTVVAAAALPAFPFRFLDFGVLYPNVYGLSLVPAFMGLLVQFFRLSGERLSPATAALTAGMAAPGVALAHPNAAMTAIALTGPLVLAYAWRAVAARRQQGLSFGGLAARLAVTAAYLICTPALWSRLRPPDEAAWWPPTTIPSGALGEALLNAPQGIRAAWLVSLLAIVGALAARSYKRLWLVGSWLLAIGLWIVVAGWPESELRTLLTGVWYNDPPRVAAILPLVVVPLAALGAHSIALWAAAAAGRLSGLGRARPVVFVGVGVALAGILALGTQQAEYLQGSLSRAATAYELTESSPMVTLDEYALIDKISHEMPPDAVVATDPWNGSSLLFAFAGIRTTTTHVYYENTSDLVTIQDHLDEAASDPQVCDSVKRLHVTYALDFGTVAFHPKPKAFPGFDNFVAAPGFVLVDRIGPAALYQVTACR